MPFSETGGERSHILPRKAVNGGVVLEEEGDDCTFKPSCVRNGPFTAKNEPKRPHFTPI